MLEKELIPIMMKIVALYVVGLKSTEERVGQEHIISHPIVHYPTQIKDVSLLFPVKKVDTSTVIHTILCELDKLLFNFGEKNKYPITYSIFLRYFKGTNGGLSTSACQDDENIFALELTTHNDTPEFNEFLEATLEVLKKSGIHQPRYHLGKYIPADMPFAKFLGDKPVMNFLSVLKKWRNSADLAASPFMTPYFQSKLLQTNALEEIPVSCTNLTSRELDNILRKAHRTYTPVLQKHRLPINFPTCSQNITKPAITEADEKTPLKQLRA